MSLEALAVCVALLSGLPVPAAMPQMVVLSQEDMAARNPDLANSWGWYEPDPWPGTIVMRVGHKRHVLAHEFTHHLQVSAGVDPETAEAQTVARIAQRRWGAGKCEGAGD